MLWHGAVLTALTAGGELPSEPGAGAGYVDRHDAHRIQEYCAVPVEIRPSLKISIVRDPNNLMLELMQAP